MRFVWALLGVAILLHGHAVQAQSEPGEARAMALQSNVVKIVATLPKSSVPRVGFGFIVGQQGNRLVIVTADHVVRGEDADGKDVEDRSPVITFFESQGYQIRGELQSVNLPKDHGDLAVILVPRPDFVRYQTGALSMQAPQRGVHVWLVGRGGEWNIPTAPGTVAQFDPFGLRIKVENLAAAVGSSGGPLISADGIVGMIVVDSGLATEATPIEPIQRQVRDVWRYDWRLTPASSAPGTTSMQIAPIGPLPSFPALPVPPAQPQPQPPPPPPPQQQAMVQPPFRRGPSFPCAAASVPVEKLICQDATLSNLDVELDGVYQGLRSRIDPEHQRQLQTAEGNWLRIRNNCVDQGNTDAVRDCVILAYQKRISFLRTF